MFCTKCGTQNNNGERFCKNCGVILENVQTPQQPNNINNGNQQYSNMNGGLDPNYVNQAVNPNMNGGLDPNYVNQAVNPNMKIWAILSIVMPVVAIIWYTFIGLSSYMAILIAAAGFRFAQKGEMADKKLAKIGNVANGILVGLAVVMFILQLIFPLTK